MIRRALLATALLLISSLADAELRQSVRFESAALAGPLTYSVYLPPSYSARASGRYPVVYLLHGVGDNETVWPRAGRVEQSLDRAMMGATLAEMIIIMPAARVSWYVDSADVGGAGNYEQAITKDLITHVDSTYRTLPQRTKRAIAGNSMGGFGALRLAFKRPELFVATAGLSPALWLHVTPHTKLAPRKEKVFRGAFGTPFDAKRFLRQGPRAYLDNVKDQAQPLGIYLYAGDDDYFRSYRSTTSLYGLLRDAGIKAELRIQDGGHKWNYWANVLPEVLGHFARDFALATRAPPPTPMFATTVVPDSGDDIAAAVASLPAGGGTVRIRAREECYPVTRSIHIDRSNISLLGEQGASLCLADHARQPVILIGSAAPSVAESEHVSNIRIADLTIDGNRTGQGNDARAEDTRSRPHLKNNGISVHGATNVFLQRLNVRAARSGGIVISQRSRSVFVSDVVLTDNFFDGIAIDGGHEVFLSRFRAENNLASGVSIDTGSSDLRVSDGLLRGNGHNGVFIRYTSNAQFSGLDIRDNCHHGVFASHVAEEEPLAHSGVRGLVFSDLTLVQNGEAGVFYGSNSDAPFFSANNVVMGSRFGGNGDGAVLGDNQGVRELSLHNVTLHGYQPVGPQNNALCDAPR